MQNQFLSVTSDPDSPDKTDPTFEIPKINRKLKMCEFKISDEQIIAAFGKIHNDSASGPDGIPAILLKECSSEFCAPFKTIWNESFALGKVPQFYKDAFINPLYKKGNRAHASNYRPVALTSHIVKTYERILRDVMVSYIEDNSILSDSQHGFRSGRSCLTELLGHFDDVLQGLTNNNDTDAIYLDFAKAFDKVDHDLLLKKLRRYGFPDQLLSWIESFLVGRTQCVVIEGVSSFVALVISGVPQGSVLGPLLFILFIDDMNGRVEFSTIRLFADDTRLLHTIDTYDNVRELQSDLYAVITWSRENNMHLHEDKFEVISHRYCPNSGMDMLPFNIENYVYALSSGDILYPVDKLRDLGVTVSSNLSWAIHISSVASIGRTMASWVFSAFMSRDQVTMITLYKSLVRNHLEYCCVLWHSRQIGQIQQLEAVQRTFTSKIWGFSHLNYWDRLKALGIMSLQRRRERYILIHMWKVLNGKSPNDSHIQFSSFSRRGIVAVIPPLVKNSSLHNQSLFDESFGVMGPRIWNSIPANLHQIGDQQQFRK